MVTFGTDWRMAAIKDGRGFGITVGAFSTAIAGGGGQTIIDIDQPEVVISIPTDTTIIPVRVNCQVIPGISAADNDETEILLAADITAAAVGGTKTAETAYNMNHFKAGNSSLCTCASAYTADMTDPVLTIELARAIDNIDENGTPANFVPRKLDLLYEPLFPVFLAGPAMLVLYFGGTVACSGFAQIQWLEYPTTYFH